MNEKLNINWYPGHMAKTKRELKEKISLIDIVYEVIDARMPISSKIVDIDDIVGNKPRILVVTKYDLCDKKETDKLLDKYIKEGYYVIKCDLVKNTGVSDIIEKTKEYGKIINEDRKKKGMKPRCVRSLVIGVPNVGKSTLINRLVKKKAAKVGDRPGVTTIVSWIRINNDIELLDSPGILWPKQENETNALILASLSSIKEEIVDKEYLASFIVKRLNSLYKDYLLRRYNLEKVDLSTIFDDIAISKKLYAKGATTDYDRVYKMIINDLKNGYFGCITLDR